jgi:DNA-binding MarR family transcriptional regulator
VSNADRRRASLALTAQGSSLLSAARQHTQAYLAQNLEGISNAEQMAILEAMNLLASLFAGEKRK